MIVLSKRLGVLTAPSCLKVLILFSYGAIVFDVIRSLQNQAGIDQKSLKFCYDRLHSLLLTLEVTNTDEFMHIQTVCDFATLVGTYTRGFTIIIEPYDERMPNIPDPVLQVRSYIQIVVFSSL